MAGPRGPATTVRTERLVLERPAPADLEELFAIESDPRVWTHYPSLRRTERTQTRAAMDRWRQGWDTHGLDTWTVRVSGCRGAIGYGGCAVRGATWNLSYRLAPDAQGRGYATELAREALRRARALDPDRPVVARLLEHNSASRHVAEKLGMALAYRAFDTGNPDRSAVRLIFSDRVLTPVQLALIET